MRRWLLSFVSAGVVALTAVAAQAFPSAPPAQAGARSDVIQVAGGCGPGWHRGPAGACRPNRGVVVAPAPVVVAPRPVVVAPRAVVVAPGPRCFMRATPRGPVRVCR